MTPYPASVLLAGLLLTGGCATRKPLHAVVNHITLDFAAGASSVAASRSGYDCRARNGPPPCAMHYGSLREFAVSDAALTGVAILLSEEGRKQHFREWFVPALAVTGANVGFAVNQWRKRAKTPDTH